MKPKKSLTGFLGSNMEELSTVREGKRDERKIVTRRVSEWAPTSKRFSHQVWVSVRAQERPWVPRRGKSIMRGT